MFFILLILVRYHVFNVIHHAVKGFKSCTFWSHWIYV